MGDEAFLGVFLFCFGIFAGVIVLGIATGISILLVLYAAQRPLNAATGVLSALNGVTSGLFIFFWTLISFQSFILNTFTVVLIGLPSLTWTVVLGYVAWHRLRPRATPA